MEVALALPFLSASFDEAARACGCSETTLREAVAKGDLTPRYLGARATKPVLLATELAEWLESRPTEKGKQR